MSLNIERSGAPLGHRILDLDVRHIDNAKFREIQNAFDQYGVIVIPGQTLTPDDHIRFSARFGSLETFTVGTYNLPSHPEIFVVSNIIENNRPIGMSDAGQFWHTDTCFKKAPARGSIMYAIEVPTREGKPLGDTMFASTAAAYDALPELRRNQLMTFKAIHSFANRIAVAQTRNQASAMDEAMAEHLRAAREKAKAENPDVEHPLVRTHPVTGRRALYLSDLLTSGIVGMSDEDGHALIAELLAHCTRPEFVYRHQWSVGDLVLWDNCSTIHNAIPDYKLPERRRMHRTTLSGSVPF